MTSQSHVTPVNHCLACGHKVDRASTMDGAAATPVPGEDITVCLYCGHIMTFAEDLTLRDLSDAQIIDVAGDPRILAIQRARKMVQQ